jgi:hypothetical protein
VIYLTVVDARVFSRHDFRLKLVRQKQLANGDQVVLHYRPTHIVNRSGDRDAFLCRNRQMAVQVNIAHMEHVNTMRECTMLP